MKKEEYKIPRFPEWLIERCIAEPDVGHLRGDYEEIYDRICRTRGRWIAGLWIGRQVLVSGIQALFDSTIWSIAMLKNSLKITFRNLIRHKVFSTINVLGLAMGMACTILMLQWVLDELSTDRFHEHAEDLYAATFENGSITTPTALGPYLKVEYPEVLHTSRFGYAGRNLFRTDRIEAYQDGGVLVEPDFLRMFTIPFVTGNSETALDDPHSILLSESVARKYFGDENAVGRTITVVAQRDLMVTGVFEEYPHNSHISCDYILPMAIMKEWGRDLNTWQYNSIRTYVMLRPGAIASSLDAKIEHLVEGFRSQEQRSLMLQPMTRLYLNPLAHTGNRIIYVYLFSVMAFFILLIACINFMNLTTARSMVRAREVGIRKAVGARKVHLIRQFFGESILLTALSLILGVGISALVLPMFNHLTGKPFTLAFFLQTRILVSIAVVGMVTTFLAGSYPALFLSHFQSVRVLKGALTSGRKGSTFRKVLVIVQFTLSVFLILGTLMIAEQIHYMRGRDLGYDRDHIVYFGIGSRFRGQAETIKTEWLSSPYILNVTLMDTPPYRWNSNAGANDVYWEGKTDQVVKMVRLAVDADYLDTFGLEMAQGRFFSDAFATDQEEAFVVNEAAVRAMEMQDPVGKTFRIWDLEGRIIGVVEDYHFESLHEPIVPMAMRMLPDWYSTACVRIHPADVQGALAFIEEKWASIYPEYPFEYNFLDDRLDGLYRSEERIGGIVRVFTILAIFISCLGLFGLASFSTEQRTKEIGIRKTCGASMPELLMLLSKEFFKLVVLACVIATPIAYVLMGRWLKTFACRTPLGFQFALIAGVLSLAIAFFTVSYHTVRAARANPVEALRYE